MLSHHTIFAHVPSLVEIRIETPLGTMIAAGDHTAVTHLSFLDDSTVAPFPVSQPLPQSLALLTQELNQYFDGTLTAFTTPLRLTGTLFQQQTWRALKTIPYGTTWSYKDLANAIGHPTAYRAVAQANAANKIAILIPCHRVINASGLLGGYTMGTERKRWLLEHEEHYRDTR